MRSLLASRQSTSARVKTQANPGKRQWPGRACCLQARSRMQCGSCHHHPHWTLRPLDLRSAPAGERNWRLNKQVAMQAGTMASGTQAGGHKGSLQEDRHDANRTQARHRQIFGGEWTDLLL